MSWNEDLSEYRTEEGREFQYFSQPLSNSESFIHLTATREVNPETGERLFAVALLDDKGGMWGSMNKETMAHIGRCLIQLAEEQGRFAHGVR